MKIKDFPYFFFLKKMFLDICTQNWLEKSLSCRLMWRKVLFYYFLSLPIVYLAYCVMLIVCLLSSTGLNLTLERESTKFDIKLQLKNKTCEFLRCNYFQALKQYSFISAPSLSQDVPCFGVANPAKKANRKDWRT